MFLLSFHEHFWCIVRRQLEESRWMTEDERKIRRGSRRM